MVRLFFSSLVFSSLVFISVANADCPVVPLEFNRLNSLMDTINNCAVAVQVASECTFDNENDVKTVAKAIPVCQRDYATIGSTEKTDYDSLMKQCLNKYPGLNDGSVQSIRALCQLRVAELYSMLYKN